MATISKINVNGTEYNIEPTKESYKGINFKTVQADGDEYIICTFNQYIKVSGTLGKVNIYSDPSKKYHHIDVIDYSIIQTFGDAKFSQSKINIEKATGTTGSFYLEKVTETYSTSGETVDNWYFYFPLIENYPNGEPGAKWTSLHGTIKFRITD